MDMDEVRQLFGFDDYDKLKNLVEEVKDFYEIEINLQEISLEEFIKLVYYMCK